MKTFNSTMPTMEHSYRTKMATHMCESDQHNLQDANKMERVVDNRMMGATEQRCACEPRDTRYAEPVARYATTRTYSEGSFVKQLELF